jgi:dynein heavy chain
MYPGLVNCTTIDWFSEWPQDALLEVAEKYVSEIQFRNEEEEKLKPSIATVFSIMQKSVGEYSKRMLTEMRRSNYVTPTNYLELVSGYKSLLYKKRQEIGDAANKLRNGLSKLDDTREKVQVMSKELEVARVQIQKFQKECDEYLIVLVQQKREADEQQKSVAQTSEKIGVEEQRCKQMTDLRRPISLRRCLLSRRPSAHWRH